MTSPRLTRLAGLVCVVAALLMIASDLTGVTLDMSNMAATVATPAFWAFALFASGWVLFGLATFRAGVFPRWSAVLLIVGGALAYLVGFPPFGLGLAVAVGILGVLSVRQGAQAAPTVHDQAAIREQLVVDLAMR